jgi:cyanophycinase
MRSKYFLIFSFLIFSSLLFSQTRGKLFIIGGAQTKEITQKFVELAGGKDARILIIPNASSNKVRSGENQKNEFVELGAKAEYIIFSKENADDPSNLEKLSWANAVYFTGGDQSLLTKDLLGTKLLEKIYELHNKGGLVGGSSAGAAVMSEIMITGNELKNKDTVQSFISIQKGNIETSKGFGFVKNAIVDQHFIKRKRHNRLITLMCEHPNLLGIAIDEATAIILNPDDTFEVFGENQVIVFDPTESENVRVDKNDNLGITNLKMHLLINGDKFDLKTKKVIE